MKRVVICGGGFGGIAAAHRLRGLLAPEDEIVLIDKGTHFSMGFRKTSEVIGRAPMAEFARPLKALGSFGITVAQASVTAIDTAALTVTAGDQRYDADAILVALGAETVPQAIPGLAQHGIDWYSAANVARAAAAVASLQSGRIAIGVFGAPYKCPPAPFELALMLRTALEERGARGIEIEVFTVLPMSLPILGAAGCETIDFRLMGSGIDLRRGAKATNVEPGVVSFEDGTSLSFDVLLAIPPHRVPAVVVESGLAPAGGWVKADQSTLRTPVDGVWAVGDLLAVPLSNGQALPKAGAFAEGEGHVAAEHIAASLRGAESDARFYGDGACFLEVGGGEAMMVRGRFLTDPPQVELTSSGAAFLEEKHRFEADRLAAWFGD